MQSPACFKDFKDPGLKTNYMYKRKNLMKIVYKYIW